MGSSLVFANVMGSFVYDFCCQGVTNMDHLGTLFQRFRSNVGKHNKGFRRHETLVFVSRFGLQLCFVWFVFSVFSFCRSARFQIMDSGAKLPAKGATGPKTPIRHLRDPNPIDDVPDQDSAKNPSNKS